MAVLLVQRVKWAKVVCSSGKEESIGRGLLVYVAFERGDDHSKLTKIASKIPKLRVFQDDSGKLNLSVSDIGGEVLLIPNFTLAADTRKGTRPSFSQAMTPQEAKELFEGLVDIMGVKSGVFADHMWVESLNDGPVNLIYRI